MSPAQIVQVAHDAISRHAGIHMPPVVTFAWTGILAAVIDHQVAERIEAETLEEIVRLAVATPTPGAGR